MKIQKHSYSFQNYLTLFTGCVSLRNLEGLVINSIGQCNLMEKQAQIISTAIDRLTHRTIIDFEGWKKIIPIGKLFQNYGINKDDLKISCQKVYHPSKRGSYNFLNAIYDGHVVLVRE